ncbi:MAG: hypothetical protein BWY67_01190 [Bacteroidetes bacterium ADurb.Bin397]|nr:MAG: hypothetical protein BWY67_01190 [Bacteroidetes bacterium ADurb.Bin397]
MESESEMVIPYPPSSMVLRKSMSSELKKSPNLMVSVLPIGSAKESPPMLISVFTPFAISYMGSTQELIRSVAVESNVMPSAFCILIFIMLLFWVDINRDKFNFQTESFANLYIYSNVKQQIVNFVQKKHHNIKKTYTGLCKFFKNIIFIWYCQSRDDWIRTSDHSPPRRVL